MASVTMDADQHGLPIRTLKDGCLIIPLQHPVKIGATTVRELHMRAEGRMSDLKGTAIGGGTMELTNLITVACNMCGELPAVIDRLQGEDLQEVIARANLFFQRSLSMLVSG